jgi:mRNA guanylyltransferase
VSSLLCVDHVLELTHSSYFLCEKTDGIRCLLYCTRDEAGNEIHYLIDRKNDYYFIEGLHLPHQSDNTFQKFHTNTILDGELVLDKLQDGSTKLRYLVFDCIILDGELLTQKPFDKRIGRIQEFIQKPLTRLYQRFPDDCANFPFEIKMKHMEKPYAVDEMFAHKLPNLEHGNDGLIFTAKASVYTFGTDELILKWKPANENSVDFKILLGGFPTYVDGGELLPDYQAKPKIHLLVYHGRDDYRHFADLYMTDNEWESMKSLNQKIDERIIECYIDEDGRWRFKREADGSPRFRDDKPEANHVSTLVKVLESIQDGVSEEDLCAASQKIKAAWKDRHPEEQRGPPPKRPAGPPNGNYH